MRERGQREKRKEAKGEDYRKAIKELKKLSVLCASAVSVFNKKIAKRLKK